jgi:hypothetical protein
MKISIRIGEKMDKARSLYGIVTAQDGQDAASFWCGVVDGPANTREHTPNEVAARYQSRVLDSGAEYSEALCLDFDPAIAPRDMKAMAQLLCNIAQTFRNDPDNVITGLPKHLAELGTLTDSSGSMFKSVAGRYIDLLQSIPPSLGWVF